MKSFKENQVKLWFFILSCFILRPLFALNSIDIAVIGNKVTIKQNGNTWESEIDDANAVPGTALPGWTRGSVADIGVLQNGRHIVTDNPIRVIKGDVVIEISRLRKFNNVIIVVYFGYNSAEIDNFSIANYDGDVYIAHLNSKYCNPIDIKDKMYINCSSCFFLSSFAEEHFIKTLDIRARNVEWASGMWMYDTLQVYSPNVWVCKDIYPGPDPFVTAKNITIFGPERKFLIGKNSGVHGESVQIKDYNIFSNNGILNATNLDMKVDSFEGTGNIARGDR